MAKKRSIRVYEMSGYKYQTTPTIMLKGQWLKEAGFDIGDYISVTCEIGKIIITQNAERTAVKAAEAEFMEREMKALTETLRSRESQNKGSDGSRAGSEVVSMFTTEELQSIGRKYFTVIVADAYDVTLISNNTRHVWYIHSVELKDRNLCLVYHKHKIDHPYHSHYRCRTLRRAIRNIKSHDEYQLNGRKPVKSRAVAPNDGCCRSFLSFGVVLLTVLLIVAKSQVFADRIMGVVDFLTSTAGLQIDLNADFINGLALQFQTDNLSITKVLFVEVGEKFDLQLFLCRLRTKFVQYLIFDRRLALVLNVKDFSVILIIKRQNLYAVGVTAFEKSFFRTASTAAGEGAKLVRTIRVLFNNTAAFTARLHVFVEFCPEASHVGLKTSFIDLQESDFIAEFAKVHGGEVVLDVVSLVQIVLIFPEGNQNLA